jgi:hypothetical protein
MPEGLGDEFVACGCPILAVKAMCAAAGLVFLVSTLGDMGIARRFSVAALCLLWDVRGTVRVLDVMGRMRCML